jgi:multicomponent K+:H+ antiporter subunit E
LLIHVFDLDDEAAFIQPLQADYEQPLKEIFE